jgi:hypothetical protein
MDKADMGYVNVSSLQWGKQSLQVALRVLSFSLKIL